MDVAVRDTKAMELDAADDRGAHLSGSDLCPDCGLYTLIVIEGCRKCVECGYSEC